MLPIITLPMEQLGLRGAGMVHAKGFGFTWDDMLEHARKRGISLDRALTGHVAEHLVKAPLAAPALFWFTPMGGTFAVHVSGRAPAAALTWMTGMAGYAEYSEGYLSPRARPLLFWDGARAIRVYMAPTPADVAEDTRFFCDFGTDEGLFCAPLPEAELRTVEQRIPLADDPRYSTGPEPWDAPVAHAVVIGEEWPAPRWALGS